MKKIVVFISFFIVSLAVCAAPFDNLIIFGDSLSDNGNLYKLSDGQYPPSPPYYQGQFSNGPVWPEQLNNYYYPDKKHLLDYAIGGASLDIDNDNRPLTLSNEINTYLSEHENDDKQDSLFVIWMGANNYLGVPNNPDEVTTKVINKISQNIHRLINNGAQEILLINLPDIGKTPFARESEQESILSELTAMHNAKLLAKYNELHHQFPQVKWLYFDFDGLFNRILANPSQYGLSNVTDACLDNIDSPKGPELLLRNPINQVVVNNKLLQEQVCQGYLFWDSIHPMASAHQVISVELNHKLSD